MSTSTTTLTRSVLITGAASGIGAGLASELAQAGHHVIVTDLDRIECGRVADRIRSGGGSAEAVALDVTSDASVAAALAALSRPCDVLVNNAGLQHVAPLEEFPIGKWDFLIQVMLTGVARLTRAVLPGMRARGFGRVVNIGSIHSLVASPFKSAYVRQTRPGRLLQGAGAGDRGRRHHHQHDLPQLRQDAAGRPADRRSGAHPQHARIGGDEPDHARADAQGGVHRLR